MEMLFDLNTITEKGIQINQTISFGEEYLKVSQIKKLDDCKVEGRIYYATTKEVIFEGKVRGVMSLVDAYTNDLVEYPFETELHEILEAMDYEEKRGKNNQNSLDLKEILWQNIVLEVPIRVSNTNQVDLVAGNGWEIKDENSEKEDPRLECFRALLDEGKE